MTEPSQYFKGRTVQEQMNEVIGYVDARAEEVAAAKADDVLEPAEQAKDDAIAAKEAAEDARDTTLAALPAIQQDIADLKAEDVSLDERLDTVEGKVSAIEGRETDYLKKTGTAQTVTSQIMVPTTATGNRDTQIANGTRIQNDLDAYVPMVRDTGNKIIAGNKTFTDNATMGSHKIVITTANKWKRIFTTPKRSGGITRTWLFAYAGVGAANTYAALLQMSIAGSMEIPTLTWLVKGSAVPDNSVAATVYNGVLNIWSSKSCALSCIGYATRSALEGAQLTPVDEADEYDNPLSDDGFTINYGVVVG